MGKVKKLAAPRPNLSAGFDPDRDRVRAEPLVLVVAPTRELCCQIFDEARRLCYRSMMRPCVAYGGAPIRDQVAQLNRGCDILVATPGRLLDFMGRPDVLSLSRVRYTIIDEADEMLHDDWEEEMAKIMGGCGECPLRGDCLLADSQQMPMRMAIIVIFSSRLRSPSVFRSWLLSSLPTITSTSALVVLDLLTTMSSSMYVRLVDIFEPLAYSLQILWVDQDKKMRALYDLLISMPPSRTLVFVRSKKTADFVDDYLFNLGMPSTSIHSDRTQSEREDAL